MPNLTDSDLKTIVAQVVAALPTRGISIRNAAALVVAVSAISGGGALYGGRAWSQEQIKEIATTTADAAVAKQTTQAAKERETIARQIQAIHGEQKINRVLLCSIAAKEGAITPGACPPVERLPGNPQ
jgi:hypothetical protein